MRRLVRILLLFAVLSGCAKESTSEPLRVLLIPADGGTESGTLADYRPLFAAVQQATGLTFDLKVAQSYGAVVEAMCSRTTDIAFVGPVTYVQARDRGCAELLAVSVKSGSSVYHAGLFVARDAPMTAIGDLAGKRVAFGDVNSTSSFVYPMAMLVAGGVDPVRDLVAIRMTGSHASSLSALIEGHVDAAALSFESYDKAVREGVPGATGLRVLARSDPIPNPPLIMSPTLDHTVKARLRAGFTALAEQSGGASGSIRGYGGGRVDGYDTNFPANAFAGPAVKMATIDDRFKGAVLTKSAER